MKFDLDHDWQGNMSTPRAKVGERAKTHLLIVLCALWLWIGLTGHSPWKPYESRAISVVKNMIDTGELLTPTAASNAVPLNPPLYYLSAALSVQLFEDILPLHDAARLATGLWMTIALLMIGMTGRELWGKGFGRQTTFVFIGSLGLVLSAHTLMPEISTLAALSTSFYALALAKRRPFRASALLGLSMGVGFLSTGLLPLAIILLTCLALPLLFSAWRNLSFASVFGLSLLIASPFLLVWPALCLIFQPAPFNAWWAASLAQFNHVHHFYFLKTLLWYAWPALPLAAWSLWRYRTQLSTKPRFQLSITFFVVAWLAIGLAAADREVFTLPLLIPLTALAGGSIDTLRRGTASALNWFGLIMFGFMSALIWLGWIAMMTGSPAKIKERMIFLSGLEQTNFDILAFSIALVVSLIWLFAVFRSNHTNRAGATNWAIGMTCVWTLLMTLWLPMIDSARSYQTIFTSLKKAIPVQRACVTSRQLGAAQRDLLHYYTDVIPQQFETTQRLDCDFYLIQDERGKEKIAPGPDWKLIWSGKRASERRESFRLFQHI